MQPSTRLRSGESLDATLRLQERNYPNEKIPVILPFHADGILAPGGMKCEGIFRVPGDSDLVSQLKLRIDRGYYTLENVDDPHMLASLLKLWLRELCDPSSPRSSTTTASMQDLIHLLVSLSREGFSETQDDGNKYGTRIVTQPAEVQSPVYDSSVYECTVQTDVRVQPAQCNGADEDYVPPTSPKPRVSESCNQ
ncbi:hypothetical protein EDC04DRAFT_3145728 [Pisolithus marmoratus]|nr:hypothetical protein EDC04DRAFT_3145728 [Pisolithus marmoratus]